MNPKEVLEIRKIYVHLISDCLTDIYKNTNIISNYELKLKKLIDNDLKNHYCIIDTENKSKVIQQDILEMSKNTDTSIEEINNHQNIYIKIKHYNEKNKKEFIHSYLKLKKIFEESLTLTVIDLIEEISKNEKIFELKEIILKTEKLFIYQCKNWKLEEIKNTTTTKENIQFLLSELQTLTEDISSAIATESVDAFSHDPNIGRISTLKNSRVFTNYSTILNQLETFYNENKESLNLISFSKFNFGEKNKDVTDFYESQTSIQSFKLISLLEKIREKTHYIIKSLESIDIINNSRLEKLNQKQNISNKNAISEKTLTSMTIEQWLITQKHNVFYLGAEYLLNHPLNQK